MSPAADPNSAPIWLADLPGATGLRSGQFGRVAVPVGAASAIRVPASAVIQLGRWNWFCRHQLATRNTSRQNRKSHRDEIELVSGLNSGDSRDRRRSVLLNGQPVTFQP